MAAVTLPPVRDAALAQAPAWARERLQGIEKALTPQRRRHRRYRLAALCAFALLLGTSTFAVAALTGALNTFKSIHGEVNKYDTTTFTFDQATTGMAQVAYAAAFNTQGAPAELDLVLAVASTAVPQNNWYYQLNVKEVSAALLGAGSYKAELLVNGASKGVLYFSQGTGLPLSIEGVTLRWDLGPTLSSAATYVVRLSTV